MTNPDDGPYGPDAFMDEEPQNLFLQVNQSIPGAPGGGGPIEAVKRVVVEAVRTAIKRTGLRLGDGDVYVDLEYPLEEENYPGVWIQFNLDSFVPSGLGHEYMTQTLINDVLTWTPIQSFTFTGKVVLSLVAMKNLDRDRMSDALLTMIGFSRTPEVWVTQPGQDTQQYRGLMGVFAESPYVSVTPNFASINFGGQGVDVGAPWQDDILVYTDTFSIELLGQTQVRFDNDGAYTLSRVDPNPTLVDSLPLGISPPAPEDIGAGSITHRTWRTL